MVTSKPSGSSPAPSNAALSAATTTTTSARPSVRVTNERQARRPRRATRPTQVAQIGSRSGLTAIAPTIRIELLLMTPRAAITAETVISAR